MTRLNVLLTAASRRVPLVRAFKSALRGLGVQGSVIVTDFNPLSPALHAADRAYGVPLATDPSYLGELLAICEAERIRLIVPTIDDELPLFGEARKTFGARGVLAACSSEETALICNDKFLTSEALRVAGVPVAATFLPTALPASLRFPLFIKPRQGRGGVGAFAVESPRELEFFLGYVPDPIVQEFLTGPEFTIDVLCDFSGRPVSIVPRERVVIRAGVSDRGRTVKSPELMALATHVCRAVPFAGPLNIQCRLHKGRPIVFEINARFSGGIPLTLAAGADFPRLLLEMAMGHDVPGAIGNFRDGLWMTNYEESVFLGSQTLRTVLLDRRLSFHEVA